MNADSKIEPLDDFIYSQFKEASRQSLIEERIFQGTFLALCIGLVIIQANDAVFFIGFSVVIISLWITFIVRGRRLMLLRRVLEEEILSRRPEMADRYVERMSYKYYRSSLMRILEYYEKMLLPASAAFILSIRYLVELGVIAQVLN